MSCRRTNPLYPVVVLSFLSLHFENFYPDRFYIRSQGLRGFKKCEVCFSFECRKVIGVAKLRYMIGLKNSRHFPIQSEA